MRDGCSRRHESSMKADEGIADIRRPLFSFQYQKGVLAWV